jgi:hypothetical protein
MMTRNVRIVAQGQADASYVENPKKNPFRLSTAILNGYQYGGETIADRNNGVTAVSGDSITTYDLFSPFSVSDWLLNNNYSVGSTNPVGISIMYSPFTPNTGSPRSSSFYTKYLLDLTKSFTLTATFLTKTSPGSPPLDGFAVAISADPRKFGGNGGGLGLVGASAGYVATTYPVVVVGVYALGVSTYLSTENTSGTEPSGSAVGIGAITASIVNTNNLTVIVRLVYNSTAKTLSWTVSDTTISYSNAYTGVDFPTLLGLNNGYVGVGAGAGAAIQPVFLTGMTYEQ